MTIRQFFNREEEYDTVKEFLSRHGSVIVTGSDKTRFDFVLSLKAEMEESASLSYVLLDNGFEKRESIPPTLPSFRYEPSRLLKQIPVYYGKGFSSFILNASDCTEVRQLFGISGFLGPDNIFTFTASSADSFRKKIAKCTSPLPSSYLSKTFSFFIYVRDSKAVICEF